MASDLSLGLSLAILFGISLLMAVSLIINHEDADIRRYGRTMMETTVHIFVGVVTFEICNSFLQSFFSDGSSASAGITAIQMIVWCVLLQLPAMQKNLGPLSTILGIASLNLWGALQASGPFVSSWFMSLLVLPVAFVAHSVISFVSGKVREVVTGSDRDEDEETWDTQVKKGENDAAAMALSFLMVQSVRFGNCGHLPDKVGILAQCDGNHELGMLCSSAAVCVVIGRLASFSLPEGQVANLIKGTVSMAFAWCVAFASSAVAGIATAQSPTVLAVIAAPSLCIVSIIAIRALDMAADQECSSENMDKSFAFLIQILGMACGVVWLFCFRLIVIDFFAACTTFWPPMVLLVFTLTVTLPSSRRFVEHVNKQGAPEDEEEPKAQSLLVS